MQLLSEPLVFAVVLAALGAVTGLIAGLFGIGGGIIIVPALATLFALIGVAPDMAMHTAVGISMITIVPTSIASLRVHARHDAIEFPVVRDWAPAVIGGAILGGFVATRLSGASLSLIFAFFVAIMAIYMGLVPADVHMLKAPPRGFLRKKIAFAIGFVSALVGIGGGPLSVPTLVLYRTPIHRAIGTASVIGLLVSLPAAFVFLLTQAARGGTLKLPETGATLHGHFGYIDLVAFAILAPAAMLTAPVGARLTHRLPAINLRRVFAVLLALIAIKMFVAGLG
jgi:uncharacterized membrane protein YfcA